MKKSLLLAAAALFAVAPAFADMYVVGGAVNGQESWGPMEDGANKMTETSTGVYEWNGQSLKGQFKMNDGGWDNKDLTIGAPADKTAVTLGEAIEYVTGDDGQNFNLAAEVTNPKVVLDMNAKTVTVTGEEGEVGPLTYYIVGANANGHGWDVANPDCAFEDKGNGLYVWEGTELGTSFKITAGAWGDHEISAMDGTTISMNVPYYYKEGGGDNISFEGFSLLIDPVVELDVNEGTITLAGGTPEGAVQWYFYRSGDTLLDSADPNTGKNELAPTEEDGVFALKNFIIDAEHVTGLFKICATGWSVQLGSMDGSAFVNPENLVVDPLENIGNAQNDDGMISYELLEGTYDITFDYNEYTLTFAIAGEDNAVESILGAEEGTPVYYNLQGQKVANPDKGIYVRVLNGNAVKVVK